MQKRRNSQTVQISYRNSSNDDTIESCWHLQKDLKENFIKGRSTCIPRFNTIPSFNQECICMNSSEWNGSISHISSPFKAWPK